MFRDVQHEEVGAELAGKPDAVALLEGPEVADRGRRAMGDALRAPVALDCREEFCHDKAATFPVRCIRLVMSFEILVLIAHL